MYAIAACNTRKIQYVTTRIHSQYKQGDVIICIQDSIIFVTIYSHFKVESFMDLRERGRTNFTKHDVINYEENIIMF